jgi:hypothetical protein
MNDPVPSLAFANLLAYTDFLAGRWLNYFERNPAARDVNIGGMSGNLRGLVTHIFQVEKFLLISCCKKALDRACKNHSQMIL